MLYSFNSDLNLLSGFPVDLSLKPPILSQNLFGSIAPEIVALSFDNKSLYVLDRYGTIMHQVAIRPDEKLLTISEYDNRAAIYMTSTIYQFDVIDVSTQRDYVEPLMEFFKKREKRL